LIKEVDDLAAVKGVAGEAIGMPRDDALSLPFPNQAEHVVEYWAARHLGAFGFLQNLNNLDVAIVPKGPLDFAFLRFDREDLAVFRFG